MFFVRTAGERDLPQISALLAETWHATYDSFYGADKVAEITGAWHSVAALRPRVGRLSAEFLVADDGERIGGMAFAASSDTDRQVVVLHQLYVHPDHQRQGIGRDLLVEIMSAFPDARRLRCEVEPANVPAVAFYRAHGFEDVGRSDDCGKMGTGIDARLFERALP